MFQKIHSSPGIAAGTKLKKMKTEFILKSDVLDILFEHRNKAYGAYNLRKFYDNRLMKSIGAMIAIVVVLSAFTFLPDRKPRKADIIFETTWKNIPIAEKKEEIKEKKEPPAEKQTPVTTKKPPTNIAITLDTHTDTLVTINDKDNLGSKNIDVPGDNGTAVVIPVSVDGGVPGGTGDKPEVAKPEIDKNIPLNEAEIMPSYPGGIDALKRFLQRNLTNPRDLEENEIISVKMKFVVGYDGKLKGFETIQDGGEEFNKEVIRVLKKMPAWVPGKSNGQNVSVYYTIPVKFVTGD